MAHAKRERVWDSIDAPVLETFEAASLALAGVVSTQSQALGSAIGWAGAGANVADVSDVRASVERVGVVPTHASVEYGRLLARDEHNAILNSLEGPLRKVELTVWHKPYWPEGTSVTFKVHGDDVDATHGFFTAAANRIDAAAQRLTRPTVVSGTQIEQATGWRGRLGAFLRHPTASQVVGGLVLTGILAVIAWLASSR